MLTSITPLGERGRGHRWSVTAVWLVVGHAAGGLVLGGALAATGAVVRALGPSPGASVSIGIIASAVVVAALFDLSGRALPGRRQVDERWLTSYRGWVYGAGFGFQLGLGLVTVVNTALVAAVMVSGAVLPVGDAVVLGLVYGLARAVAATANGWVRSVADLRRLHRFLDHADRPAQWAIASLGVVGALVAVVSA